MTEQELTTEWSYRYKERFAILGVTSDPTPEQHNMAKAEADQTIAELRKE